MDHSFQSRQAELGGTVEEPDPFPAYGELGKADATVVRHGGLICAFAVRRTSPWFAPWRDADLQGLVDVALGMRVADECYVPGHEKQAVLDALGVEILLGGMLAVAAFMRLPGNWSMGGTLIRDKRQVRPYCGRDRSG